MIRALLFDAAGTLLEPTESVADTYARHFCEQGWEIGPAAVREAFPRIFRESGEPDYSDRPCGDLVERNWWRGLVFRTMLACGVDPAADVARADDCFERLFAFYGRGEAWRVFPEVVGVLAAAGREGLRLAVVSNFDRRLHRILAELGLDFEFVLTSADARARKPDPAIFRLALARLELRPEEVRHAGDCLVADIAGARAAGIGAFHLERPRNDLGDFLRQVLAAGRK